MTRPKNPTENLYRDRTEPSAITRERERSDAFERSIPGRTSPEYVKQRDRAVNDDEQQKIVNVREDNAQSESDSHQDEQQESAGTGENLNERFEAGDDNSEVNPNPGKVN